jgi:dolichyl-phosphate-mannose-protein mannosyltransferase
VLGSVAPTSAPPPPPPAAHQQKLDPLRQEAPPAMSEAPPFISANPLPSGQSIISREEKIEYRDQDGNILDPEQVKALEGKVSFKTRYETRTRMIDAQGNEIMVGDETEDAGVAPPHPDVDNVDQETVGVPEPEYQESPASPEDVTADEQKEESIEKSQTGAAKPASEGNEATA